MRPDQCRDYAAPIRCLSPSSFIPVSFSNAILSRAGQQIKLFLLTQMIVAFFLYVLLLTLVAGLYLLLLFDVWRMAELNAVPPSSEEAVPGECIGIPECFCEQVLSWFVMCFIRTPVGTAIIHDAYISHNTFARPQMHHL